MKLAVLFSGGKDSVYAMYKAMKHHEVVCLISIESENQASYMFHTPNISLVEKQAKAIGLPIIIKKTKGVKEEELDDLKDAIIACKDEYGIEGIVTGAIESVYQASRVQKICNNLKLWVFNPLWKIDQLKLLNELIDNKFEVVISGVFAFPFGEEWLGRKIDVKMIDELKQLADKYQINPSGEGGEIETTVLNAPFFKKAIKVIDYDKIYSNYCGDFIIRDVELIGR